MEVPAADGLAGLRVAAFERVPVHLSEGGGVGSEAGGDAFRQNSAREAVEPFEHAGARPVKLYVFIENQEDAREAEHRVGAHRLHAGHPEQGTGERVGDLVFDVLRTTAGPGREDDLLVLADVRDGVHRHRIAREARHLEVEGCRH